jgi:hypothetical protein
LRTPLAHATSSLFRPSAVLAKLDTDRTVASMKSEAKTARRGFDERPFSSLCTDRRRNIKLESVVLSASCLKRPASTDFCSSL